MSTLPPVVDQQTWRAALDALRVREKAATRELDAIAAQRRRLPMVELPDYTVIGADGPVRLVDVFDGKSQLIVYHHMWADGAQWQCPGCTGTPRSSPGWSSWPTYDARFVIVATARSTRPGPKARVGNAMSGTPVGGSSPPTSTLPRNGFAINAFLRDGATVYRTWYTTGRGVEQLGHIFGFSTLPWGRQEEWQDSPRLAATADFHRLGRRRGNRASLRRRSQARRAQGTHPAEPHVGSPTTS